MRESRPFDLRLFVMAAGAGVVDVISLTTLGAFTAAVTANMVFIGIAIEDGDAHLAIRAGSRSSASAREPFSGTALSPESRRSGGAHGGRRCWWGSPRCRRSSSRSGWRPPVIPRAPSSITYVSGSLVSLLGAFASPGSPDPEWRNQLGVIVALLIGALIGAVLLSQARGSVPVLPLALTILVAGATVLRARRAA
jgi:uncharacterized membrane protein YoaK (UPF0700 family)